MIANRKLDFRVRISNGLELIDVTRLVTRVAWGVGDVSAVGTGSLGVDATVGTAQLSLVGVQDWIEDSVDLLWSDGVPRWWSDGSQAISSRARVDGLFRDYAEIRIDSRVAGGAWAEDFRGYLGDGFRWSGQTVELLARDPAKLLQDTQLDNITTYGSEEGVAAETVIRQLMTQHLGSKAPVLYCPVSPNALVGEYLPRDQSVWDAIQAIALRFGWYLGYLRVGGQYRLTLLEPPRSSAAPHKLSLGWDDIITEDLTWSTRDVRNSVTIEYADADGELARYTKQDPWSIQNVTGGVPKHSHITVEGGSGIDTLLEAQRLADVFLSDLGRTLANTQVQLPFSPDVQLFSELTILNPARSPEPGTYSVNSVQHSITVSQRNAQFRTTVLASGQVIGGHRKWLDREPRPGSPGDPSGPHLSQLRAPQLAAAALPNAVLAGTNGLTGVGAVGMEVHTSASAGFTPNAGTLVSRGPDTRWTIEGEPGTMIYVRAREFDARGGTGPWSNEASAAPTQAGLTAEQEDAFDLVALNAQVWQDTAQTVADGREFWDAASATLDGTLLTGVVSSATTSSLTEAGRDWATLGIQPGDQIRVFGDDDAFQIRAVIGVTGGTLTVSEPWDPVPAVGSAFEVGRVTRVTAKAITDNEREWRREFGELDTNLSDLGSDLFDVDTKANTALSDASDAQDAADAAQNAAGDAQAAANAAQGTADGIADELNNPLPIQSNFASISLTAKEARQALQRQESDFLQSGTVDSATSSTLVDSNGNYLRDNGVLVGDVILIMDGAAAGVQRSIASRTATTLVLTQNWPANKTPALGDSYIVGRVQRVASTSQTQTADALTSIATNVSGLQIDVEDLEKYWQPFPLEWSDGAPRLWSDGTPAVSSTLQGQDAFDVDIAFSLIEQNAHSITQAVVGIDGAHSLIQQLAAEILLRVERAGVVSAINLSSEQIKILSRFIHLDGDTTIGGNFKVKGKEIELTGDTVISGNFKVTGERVEINGNTTVTGNVTITDPNNLGHRFEVWDAGGQLRMAMGNIRDLQGVPAGNQFGLWGQWGSHIRMLGVAAFWPLLSYSQQQFALYPDPSRLTEQIQPNATQFMFSNWITLDLPQLPTGIARHFYLAANNVLAGTSLGYDGHTLGRLIPEDFQFQLMYRTGPAASWQTLPRGALSLTIPAAITTAYECRIRLTANLRNIHSVWVHTEGTADYRYGFGTTQLACNYVLGNMSA